MEKVRIEMEGKGMCDKKGDFILCLLELLKERADSPFR